MAKPYISDEEAARIDADAAAGGYKALRAPSKSSWLNRVLGKPTFLRSRADALREEREKFKSRAESSLEAAADTINIVKQVEGARELGRAARRVVNTATGGLTGGQSATMDDVVTLLPSVGMTLYGGAARRIGDFNKLKRPARESAVAAAVAGAPTVIEAPGLVLSKELRAAFGSNTPERFSKILNERLLDTYRGLRRTPPGVFGDHYVVNSPSWIAGKLTDLGGDLTVGNLVKHKVFGVNSTPWEHMSALERDLWREKGQLPLSSIYFYRGKAAAPTGRFRGATHWDNLTVGTPVGTDELNVTVGSRTASPALLDRMALGTRTGSSSFTLVENPASEGPIMVRPRVGDYFGRPLAGGQIGGTGEPWLHQDAKGGDTRAGAKGGPAAETFDTPIPEELRAKYDAWYAQLPKNLQYTGDYDLQGAWLEKLGQPDKYEAAQNGHLDDYGKKPNHITFSTGSKWHDPKVPERTGGEWRQAKDGSWDFYPGTGNKASDDELKAYFEKYEKGSRVHRREMHQDAKGGDGGSPEDIPPEPGEGASSFLPSAGGGPRIVINPTTFKNKKDALCVAFNEGFRLWMEANDFQPRSEPTDAQRKFFSDTAYADDELQLRRTILARIATFDTSVKDPTDDQLAETAEFLGAILESDWCKNEWERDCVSRLAQAAQAAVGAEPVEARQEPLEAREAEPLQARAAMGGGETDDEENDKAGQAVPAQETESGVDLGYAMERMGGVAQQQQEQQEQQQQEQQQQEQQQQEQDVNGDGTAIDHSADYEAQLDSEHQEDVAEANAEYEKLRQSGALDDPASFDNGGQTAGKGQARETAASPGLGAEKPASQGQKSEEEPKETGSQGAPRPGAIGSGVVSKNSPGSLSYRGPRTGAIEDPIVNPASQGSIGFSGVRDGGIERPTVDPNSPGSLSYRRRRRKRR